MSKNEFKEQIQKMRDDAEKHFQDTLHKCNNGLERLIALVELDLLDDIVELSKNGGD